MWKSRCWQWIKLSDEGFCFFFFIVIYADKLLPKNETAGLLNRPLLSEKHSNSGTSGPSVINKMKLDRSDDLCRGPALQGKISQNNKVTFQSMILVTKNTNINIDCTFFVYVLWAKSASNHTFFSEPAAFHRNRLHRSELYERKCWNFNG